MSIAEISAYLRETREGNNLKIEDAARDLKVRPHFLEMLEGGEIEENRIYLAGYLKSYAEWLGLNSDEILNKMRRERSKEQKDREFVEKSAQFLYVGPDAKPNFKVILFSLFFTILIYIVWFNINSSNGDVGDVSVLNAISQAKTEAAPVSDAAVSYIDKSIFSNVDLTFVLYAKDNLELTVSDANGQSSKLNLASGEAHFFNGSNGVFVTSDKPKAVEVFIEGDEHSYLGTLDQFK